MIYFFVNPQGSLYELKKVIATLEAAGYDTNAVAFRQSWEDFLKEVPDHSTIVVYSVDFFNSLMELLGCLAELQERGIALKSLQEPWLSEPVSSTTDFLIRLRQLAFTLHATQTKRGLRKAQAAGKTMGRPRKIADK